MALRAPLPGHWSTSKQVVVFFALNWPALWALHLGNLILGMAAGLVGVVQYKATFAVFAGTSAAERHLLLLICDKCALSREDAILPSPYVLSLPWLALPC